jgi:ubiquinone/menaquinone biosynthesis C-methylase UbiE
LKIKKAPWRERKVKTFEQKSIESYNQKAVDYDNSFEGKFTENFKSLLLKEMVIAPGNTVLDIACGNGRLLKLLSDRYSINVYGIDIADKMVEAAKALQPGMNFYVSSCDNTPFADGMFDVISVCAAYHHFPDVSKFAAEAARILKPKGSIYIADVYYPDMLRRIMNLVFPLSKAGDVKAYSPKEIETNFASHGFTQTCRKLEGNIQLAVMRKS